MLSNVTIPSERSPRVSRMLDGRNLQFTSEMKRRLAKLAGFNESFLEWLMAEHFQFSFHNPAFLSTSAKTADQFEDKAIAKELWRNFLEEKSHATIYKRSLAEMGTDVAKRVEFAPTTQFFDKIQKLITDSAPSALGAMYATETAAIFEHEVFRDVSREICERRGIDWESTRLKTFHDMHLDGVEQSHKDGLADFVDRNGGSGAVLDSGMAAIDAMVVWWNALLGQVGMR